MPTKKAANRPSSKRSKIQWKTKDPTGAGGAVQGELFDAACQGAGQAVEVTLRVPAGTPITIGNQKATGPAEISVTAALQKLAGASKEELRAAMASAKLQSQQIIGLCTVLHGNLYHLAAIGAKVRSRK